ncbi:serine/threonine protein phosphatase 2A regulatory subunit B''beta-like [Elaeis guineensis]|uniref:serine/threonine protein phosphatase 2A regulatory subunit B''beta-like n=1 Tax=Elaeis guineensis var. tenera TaxID=51953 RepID=UPI003C6DB33F
MVEMDVEAARDIAASLDLDLLQLPEISLLALKQNPSIAEHLYSQWLSLPETRKLVKFLLDNIKAGLSLNVAGSSGGKNATASNTLPSMFPAVHRHFRLEAPLELLANFAVVLEFYSKNGLPPSFELKEQCLSRIIELFYGYLNGLQVQGNLQATVILFYCTFLKDRCRLPWYCTKEDFKPVLRELLASHPGLEFLQSTPEFQEQYGKGIVKLCIGIHETA